MIDLATVQALDQKDSLAEYKNHFTHTSNEIYMDGNSLGKLPKVAQKTLEETIQNQWGKRLIRSWNEVWLDLPLRLAKKYGQLLHVKENEIIIGESTSVRLYQILYALINADLFPKQLGSDQLNFPTDLYIMEGLVNHFSLAPTTLIDYEQEIVADVELLKKKLKLHPGIYCLSLVTYKSAFLYPMRELNLWAEKHNSIIVWDLSHAVGAVEIDLKKTKTKIALGCSYKYMCGGPGSPAFMYIAKKLQHHLFNPIRGWFGHQNPFTFESTYQPALGINRFASGTIPVLSMQAMEAGVDLILSAGMVNLYQKSIQLSKLFLNGVQERLIPLGFRIESPLPPNMRGSHLTLSHAASWQICQALIKGSSKSPKIIPDFRPPHYVRFGIAPLYTSFEDIYRVIIRLEEIILTASYSKFDNKKPKVT